jgi:hypothetical protein
MMRSLALCLLLTLVPGAAFAQTTTTASQGRLDIVGEAPNACVISSAGSAAGANAVFRSLTAGAAEVRITEMIDPQTSTARASSINILLPIICNGAHRLVLTSGNGGLLRDGGSTAASPGGFREFVPYQVSAVWSGQTAANSSDRGPVIINVRDGAAGDASVTIDVPGGGAPLIAGGYSDAVVIELQVEN